MDNVIREYLKERPELINKYERNEARFILSLPPDYETVCLVKQGTEVVEVERTFDGIRTFLNEHVIEGLVFWMDGEPMCKKKNRFRPTVA